MNKIKFTLLTICCMVLGVTTLMVGVGQPLNTYANVDFVSAPSNATAPILEGQESIINNVIFVTLAGEEGQASSSDFNDLVEEIDGILNTNTDSMKNYYKALSSGKLDLTSNIMTQTRSGNTNVFVYNSSITREETMPFSTLYPNGFTGLEDRNQKETAIISGALTALDSYTNNLPSSANLDQNNDGYIDAITICVLNEGSYYQRIPGDSMLWAHNWVSFNPPSIGDKKVSNFIMLTSDKITGGGLYVTGSALAHEMGHQLGFLDLYEAKDGSANYVGSWDLMANDALQYMNSYSRKSAGWIENSQFIELTTAGTYTLKAVSYDESRILNDQAQTKPVVCYYIEDPKYEGQLICLEYRSQTSSNFDKNVPDSGLIIYRVDTNRESNGYYFAGNYYNTSPATVYVFRPNNNARPTTAFSDSGLDNFGIANNAYQEVNGGNYITFQEYNKTQSVDANIPYTTINSGIVVSNVKINANDTITFDINGPTLLSNPEITSADFNDTNLFNKLATAIGKSQFDKIYANDFTDLTALDLSGQGITDLTGLELLNLSSLTYLNLSLNNITNGLDLIKGITSLETLVMQECQLTDISFITGMGLKYVNFVSNSISDFSPLLSLNNLVSALMVFNNFDASLNNNQQILTAVQNLSTKYLIGIQSVASTNYLGSKYVLFSASNFDANAIFTFTKDSQDYTTLNAGYVELTTGRYSAGISVPKGVFNQQSTYTRSISFRVINVQLIEDYVEVMQGDQYIPDTAASLTGFAGNQLSLSIQTKFGENGELQDGCLVDTSVPGVYYVIFNITSINSDDTIVLTKTVKVYGNEEIKNDETGIPDTNLYKALLTAVGKNPELIGVNDSGKLYVQDFYFYEMNNANVEPITTINLRNSNISSLQGIDKLNLSKVTKIVLNNNDIIDISPLFGLYHLTELHLAGNEISSIEGIETLTNLTKLDLSFNNIISVLPLKTITEPYTIYNSNGEQNLVNVNIMFNQLDMSLEDNNWILSTSNVSIGDFVTPNEIFIVLVQGLSDGDIYTETSKFTYHQTKANEYTDAYGTTAYRYIVRNNNVAVKWTASEEILQNSGRYTIGIDTINRLYEITYDSRYDKVCYVYDVDLADLQSVDPNKTLLLQQDDPNAILTTETILLPTSTDVEFSTIRGMTLTDELRHIEVILVRNSQGNTFANHVAGNYTIQYVISTFNANTHDLSDETTLSRTIRVIQNNMVVLDLNFSDPENAAGIIDQVLFDAIVEATGATINQATDQNGGIYYYLYQYDTYNLTSLDFSYKGITYVNGLRDFKFDNLRVLRLKGNNIQSIKYLATSHQSSNTFKNLMVLDLSFNQIEDASYVKDIESALKNSDGSRATLYINLMVNKIDLSVQTNRIVMNPEEYNIRTTGAIKDVLVGIQGLDAEQEVVTFGDDLCQAGFYYYADNLRNATLTSTAQNDVVDESSPNYVRNQYHYFPEAGIHNVRFSSYLNVSNIIVASVDFSATIRHGKVYLESPSVTVDYSASDTDEERQQYIDDTGLVFEGMDISEFNINSQIPSFSLSKLITYTQVTNVSFKNDNNISYTFNKSVVVADREAPVISFVGEPLIIVQKGNPTGLNSNYGVDVDVFVTDNYDQNITIDYVITNKDGVTVDRVDVNSPDTYTVTFIATDLSNNKATPVSRTIKVNYRQYSVVNFEQPEAQVITGQVEFKAQIIIADGEEMYVNPNPVFYWFVDGEFVGSSVAEESDNQYIINTTYLYEATEAGEHIVTLRINNATGDLSEENSQYYEKTYFVLLDNSVVQGLIIGGVALVVLIIVALILIFYFKRRRRNKYQKYDNNTYKA